MHSSYRITNLTEVKNLNDDNVMQHMNIHSQFNFTDYTTIKSMVKSLSFMKVVAENVHLISKNPLGDPICRSWTVEYIFKFKDLGNIDMLGNLQFVKCTKFKSDEKPKPKPTPTPKKKRIL